MSNRAEYLALVRLQNNPDYRILESKWLYLVSEIQNARDKAASRGKGDESAWRYFAGQEKGAQRIITALSLAIKDLEEKSADEVSETNYDELLKEARGEK